MSAPIPTTPIKNKPSGDTKTQSSTPTSTSTHPSDVANNPLSPINSSGDDILGLIRLRFNNPDHSIVPFYSVSQDLVGLSFLMSSGAWKACLKLSSLLASSSTYPHLKLRYRAIKIASMLKLLVRNHSLLQLTLNELAEIGDQTASSNLYQTYPELYPNKFGSMVPFSLSLLNCEANYLLSKDLKFFFQLHQDCIDRAQQLKNPQRGSSNPINPDKVFDQSSENIDINVFFEEKDELSAQVWFERADQVAFSILTRQVQTKEYFLALQTIQELLSHHLSNQYMLGTLLRIHLLCGNVSAAQKALSRMPPQTSFTQLHEAILLIAHSKYQEALSKLENILKTDPYNMTAVNNAAVCHTFLTNAPKAVNLLEDALFTKPESNLNETSVFNLCTLYELLTDKAIDRRRKVLQLVLDHAPDHFNLLSLRLPPGSLNPQ